MGLRLPSRNSSDEDFVRDIPEKGNIHGVCYAVIDVGVQQRTGRYPKPQHQIYMLFELTSRVSSGPFAGQRHGVNKRYALSAFEQGYLFKDIETWLDVKIEGGSDTEPGTDIEELVVGQLALLKIVHSDDGKYANIGGLMSPMKDAQVWEPENGPTNPNWRIPRWIQTIRLKAIEPPGDLGSPFEPDMSENWQETRSSKPSMAIPGQSQEALPVRDAETDPDEVPF